jgi:phage FluMu protein Com
MEKVNLICPKCEKKILKVKTCSDLTVECPCGEEILLNVDAEAMSIKIRKSNKRNIAG